MKWILVLLIFDGSGEVVHGKMGVEDSKAECLEAKAQLYKNWGGYTKPKDHVVFVECFPAPREERKA